MHHTAKATIVAALAGCAVTVARPALADTSGAVTGSVNVAPPPVRSLTVTPTVVTLDTCVTGDNTPAGSALTLPNGICTSPNGSANTTPITITNGKAPSHITVSATAATPADHGTPWTLRGSGRICTNASLPG